MCASSTSRGCPCTPQASGEPTCPCDCPTRGSSTSWWPSARGDPPLPARPGRGAGQLHRAAGPQPGDRHGGLHRRQGAEVTTHDAGAAASPLDNVSADSGRPTESTVRIGLVLPDVMGTYGDDGNALVLRQRLRWRGHDAEIVRITLDDEVPASCDVYTVGGGEDSAQKLASRHLSRSPGLQSAVGRGVPVLAICAGMQVFGEWFAV